MKTLSKVFLHSFFLLGITACGQNEGSPSTEIPDSVVKSVSDLRDNLNYKTQSVLTTNQDQAQSYVLTKKSDQHFVFSLNGIKPFDGSINSFYVYADILNVNGDRYELSKNFRVEFDGQLFPGPGGCCSTIFVNRGKTPNVNLNIYVKNVPSFLPDKIKIRIVRFDQSSKKFEYGYYSFEEDTSLKDAISFNTQTVTNDLDGNLKGQVFFSQSHLIPSTIKQADLMPRLVGSRKALLLFRPEQANNTSISVTVKDQLNKTLGVIALSAPKNMPKTAYYKSGVNPQLDFSIPSSATTKNVNTTAEMNLLSDSNATFLKQQLKIADVFNINTADGFWTGNIYLPEPANSSETKALEGKMVVISSRAGYPSSIYTTKQSSVVISYGQKIVFKFNNGQWLTKDDVDNSRFTYAQDAWTAQIPAQWVLPGMQLTFSRGSNQGTLKSIDVGAPTEVLLNTIDVGMLTKPRGEFAFAYDTKAHAEYFQTLPASKFLVSQYTPLYLTEVMMPDGRLLKEKDPSVGGWHNGDMREFIGKQLISLGINNANYGVNGTAGTGENTHPYTAAQITAHNSVGMYENGRVVHGGSGGAGIVTLDSSLDNEFSHELGHNYGLGHYEGGFDGSVHRSAEAINSAWGWEAEKNLLIPNFYPTSSAQPSCLDNKCQQPFYGRSFGFDAMAGGSKFSDVIRFTHYTPYSAKKIQSFLENKAVFDKNSPTFFSKWNQTTKKMEAYENTLPLTLLSVPIDQVADSTKISGLLSRADLLEISLYNGRWNKNINIPAATLDNQGKSISVKVDSDWSAQLSLNNQTITASQGFNKTYVSNGSSWVEGNLKSGEIRKPAFFGVPVVTLLGYYDPEQTLTSYAYPATYGAYGFAYSDNGSSSSTCRLEVNTNVGIRYFKLPSSRINSAEMNKYHVNVPASQKPSKVSVVCNNQILATRNIDPASQTLIYTVNGKVPDVLKSVAQSQVKTLSLMSSTKPSSVSVKSSFSTRSAHAAGDHRFCVHKDQQGKTTSVKLGE